MYDEVPADAPAAAAHERAPRRHAPPGSPRRRRRRATRSTARSGTTGRPSRPSTASRTSGPAGRCRRRSTAALDWVFDQTGTVVPLADFLYADVYDRLMGEGAARRVPGHPRGGGRAVPPPVVRAGDHRLAAVDRRRPRPAAAQAGDHLQDRGRSAAVLGDDPQVEPRRRRCRKRCSRSRRRRARSGSTCRRSLMRDGDEGRNR